MFVDSEEGITPRKKIQLENIIIPKILLRNKN